MKENRNLIRDIEKSEKMNDFQKRDLIDQIKRNDQIETGMFALGVAIPMVMGLMDDSIFGIL